MKRRNGFKKVRRGARNVHATYGAEYVQFQEHLSGAVTGRFERMTGLTVATAPVDLPDNPCVPLRSPHPDCLAFADTEYCRKSWRDHVHELHERPEIHWHRCTFGMYCAVLPIVWDRCCVAACQLVCPDSLPAEHFERQVELLDVLIENFLHREAALLISLMHPVRDGADCAVVAGEEPALAIGKRTAHPQVLAALDYIERHLTDSNMTVSSIARALDVNATYVAHLFSLHAGMRMSRYIAAARIELAKRLLLTTNWQIKRVAFETGHSNPYWFSEVFRAHTGVTPSKFRKTAKIA